MSVSSVAVVLLLLCGAQHAGAMEEKQNFYGTVITFEPKDTDADGSLTLVLHYKNTFESCTDSVEWKCRDGYDCGSETSLEVNTVQQNGQQWCQREGIMTRIYIPNSSPGFFMSLIGPDHWIPNEGNVQSMKAVTNVNLMTRSDTGKANSSPQTTIIPYLRVPSNCGRNFNLLAFDPDGDRVKCFSNGLPSILSMTIDCTLSFSATSEKGPFVAKVLMADYPNQDITLTAAGGSPRAYTTNHYLSSIPLQFVLQVDGEADSCTEGEYIPKFLLPTPANRAQLDTPVGKTLEINIKAEATKAGDPELLFSGPHNMILTGGGPPGEFTLRWTPSESEDGEHHPVCFVALSEDSFQAKYQSELRCVIISVLPAPPTTHVICNEASMTVELDKSKFERLAGQLQLNDKSNTACTLEGQQNSTHIIAEVPLSGCGTEIEEDDENLIFKNAITNVDDGSDDGSDVITRKHLFDVEVSCEYPKTGIVKQSYSVHRDSVTVQEKGFGTFTYQFEFFDSQDFTSMKDPDDYPLKYDVGDKIYIQIDASSSLDNTELFVESCSAAPYDNPQTNTPAYSIIADGCKKDLTVEVVSEKHKKYFQFSMEAFKFIGSYDQVYISCSVILCKAENKNTRCSEGCKRSNNGQRRKREAGIQTARHYISQGPLRLRRSSEITATSLNLNLNLVLVAGCLLTAVAMICAVAFYKIRKTTREKYELLPSTDSVVA